MIDILFSSMIDILSSSMIDFAIHQVTVPSELEGIAYIQVTIQRDNEQLVSAPLNQFGSGAQRGADLHWQNKLEAAQNVLFCKVVFFNFVQPLHLCVCARFCRHCIECICIECKLVDTFFLSCCYRV